MSVMIAPEANRPVENDPEIHLRRLFAEDTSKPWFYTIFLDIKETIFPP